MKVKIYTHAYNRPDFIPLQQRNFSSLFKDDFEYIVFNNAVDKNNDLKIKEVCEQIGVRCIDIEKRKLEHPSISHAAAIDWSFHEYIKHDTNTIAVILDSDMFMINEFSIIDYLYGYDIAAIIQNRHITYLGPAIMFFNLDTLPNKNEMSFMCGDIEGARADVGGRLYYWLKNNPELKIRYMSTNGIICLKNNNLQFIPKNLIQEYDEDYQFGVIEKTFLHYRKGSNWNSKSNEFHKKKTIFLERFLTIVNEKRVS
jgi:hypothetical protein